MFLFEFNNLDLEDKRDYINELPPTSNDKGRFVTYRKEGDMYISLWDCDTFFAEMYALNRKVFKIEGIELWLGLKNEDWVKIHKRLEHQSIRPEPRKPRPYQKKAIEGAVRRYIENKATRGRLIVPCGTDKSLPAFWVANVLLEKSIK
jgi:predicted helicase